MLLFFVVLLQYKSIRLYLCPWYQWDVTIYSTFFYFFLSLSLAQLNFVPLHDLNFLYDISYSFWIVEMIDKVFHQISPHIFHAIIAMFHFGRLRSIWTSCHDHPKQPSWNATNTGWTPMITNISQKCSYLLDAINSRPYFHGTRHHLKNLIWKKLTKNLVKLDKR